MALTLFVRVVEPVSCRMDDLTTGLRASEMTQLILAI